MQDDPNDQRGRQLAALAANRIIRSAGRFTGGLLIRTMPVWLPIAILVFFSWFSFDNIYGVAKDMTQRQGTSITAKIAAFFGFQESKDFVQENADLFDRYKEIADTWKEGLTDDQITQAETHGLSWAILVAVDRLANDPYIHKGKKITLRPKEVEKDLRPQFEWKESVVTTVTEHNWYVPPDENGEGGGCESETTIEEETVLLLTRADTIEGTYLYEYEWKTESHHVEGDCGGTTTTVTAEVIKEMKIPKPEELYQPLYEYLKANGIKKDLDIELALMLAELYDDNLRITRGMYQNMNWRNYPQLLGMNDWVWVTPSTRITSSFGPRTQPRPGFHAGVDIGGTTAGVEGDPIWSMTDGTVTVSGWVKGYGITIYIDHGQGMVTRYAHLQRSYVSVGQKVERGDLIALMGNTGDSTGPHLHFEIQIDKIPYDPVYYFANIFMKEGKEIDD